MEPTTFQISASEEGHYTRLKGSISLESLLTAIETLTAILVLIYIFVKCNIHYS